VGVKTDFTDSELALIHRAIGSMQFYGYNDPRDTGGRRFAAASGSVQFFRATNSWLRPLMKTLKPACGLW